MKKLALAAAAVSVMFAGEASAADMAVKAPVPPAPIYSWTGFYIGGDIGGWWERQSGTTVAFPAGFGAPAVPGGGLAGVGILPTFHRFHDGGVLGGLYAGYNWQTANWVVGIEGDVSYLGRRSSDTQSMFETFTAVPAVTGTMQLNATNDWLASVRGRVGWAKDRVLVYGTGGVAFTESRYSALMIPGPPNGVGLGTQGGITVPLATSFSQNRVGWVVGAGLEWMATANWILRAEYLYYRFDGSGGVLPVSTTGPGGGVCVGCGWRVNFSDLEINTVRVGASYKFGGPIVAKY